MAIACVGLVACAPTEDRPDGASRDGTDVAAEPAPDAAPGDATPAGVDADSDGAVPWPTDGSSTAGGSREPRAEFLPVPHGSCPDFDEPIITLATPMGPRTVKIALTDAATTVDGPLVFYWHGWHRSNTRPISISGWARELLDMGGILVHPMIDEEDEDGYWDDDDLVLADQVVACASERVGIDTRRIYTIGFSAGGFHTYRLAQLRSGYIAAAVMYSPGSSGGARSPYQDPDNPVPAMITHGGETEPVFERLAEQYFDQWIAAGRFAFICEHDRGHAIPSGAPATAWEFLSAHPFGTTPSPYAGGLPASFPDYCGLRAW